MNLFVTNGIKWPLRPRIAFFGNFLNTFPLFFARKRFCRLASINEVAARGEFTRVIEYSYNARIHYPAVLVKARPSPSTACKMARLPPSSVLAMAKKP